MHQQVDLKTKSDYFSIFSVRFSSLKPEIIKQAINKFNCDYDKINDFLVQHSYEESSSCGKKSSSDSIKSPGYFSFASLSDSLESDPNSPALSRNHYRNSSELSTISSQTCDLKRLQDAFKNMETNRDDLVKEKKCLMEVSNRRKSVPSFPSITELEKLERIVNNKYSMPPKSISYANDLRRPEEMNSRFRGFHPPYNNYSQNFPNNNNNNNFNVPDRRNSEGVVMMDPLNPNFYVSPKPRNNFLNPLKKQEEKRNSAHFSNNSELPEEFIGHKYGHFRQSSDPRILDNLDRNNWKCPQCTELNTSSKCSFCQYDNSQSDRL